MKSLLFWQRFCLGMAIGLFVASIVWSYSYFYGTSPSLERGIIGSLLMAICCGAVAGFSNLDKLMDNLPFL